MGTVNLGRIMFRTRGAWANATAYSVDDIVNYAGMTFICKFAHTSAALNEPLLINIGRVNTQWWDIFQEGFTWRGAWANNTLYYPGDVVKSGQSSYICRKEHTSSENNRDVWYDPYNEWDEFTHGGENVQRRRIRMLLNRGPVGWTGHPFITAPNWGNGAWTWNGNIPRNIPAAAKRWEWNHASGSARVNMLRKQLYVTADGRMSGQGVSGDYSFGQSDTSVPAGFNLDPSWMRDYWNNTSQTTGFKGSDYTKDTNSGMPTVVQISQGYYSSLALMSNGTVVRNGIGIAGQNAFGNANDSTNNGASQINFPMGTFIVKVGHSNPAGTDDNTSCYALDSEGNLWAWGRNRFGELGIGSEATQGKVIGMLNDARADGSATGSYRDYENTPKRIPKWAFDNKRIVDFWAVGRIAGVVYALDEAGVLWSWGYNNNGQLGYNTNTGFRHTDASGVPFQFGRNGYVDLAGTTVGTAINWANFNGIQKICINSPDNPDVGTTTIYILDGTGHLWACGWGNTYSWGDNTTVATMTNATALPRRLSLNANSANLNGNIHNFWVCGNGDEPTIFVRKSDGTTWGWGRNGYNELTDGTTTNRNFPVQTLGVTNALTISSSGHDDYASSVALTIDANSRLRIFTAGRNGYGVLGFGDGSGTHATGGSQGAGTFHRINGANTFSWAPIFMPAGLNRATRIRDVQMAGGGSEPILQVLFEDGTLMNTGSNQLDGANLNYFPISNWNGNSGNVLRKPTGTY
jgi:alpha-tubulin suppressor-like RCC1 family protein